MVVFAVYRPQTKIALSLLFNWTLQPVEIFTRTLQHFHNIYGKKMGKFYGQPHNLLTR